MKWTKWTEVKGMDQSSLKGTRTDQMNRSGPRRHKWTDWTESDRMD